MLRFPIRVENDSWWGKVQGKAADDGISLNSVALLLFDAWLEGDVVIGARLAAVRAGETPKSPGARSRARRRR